MTHSSLGRGASVLAATLLLSTACLTLPAAATEATMPAASMPVATLPAATSVPDRLTVYTSVTQDTVDEVLAALEVAHPELDVQVFRAPTGELDARVATELRTGGLAADVLWLTDPLAIARYDQDGLLAPLAASTLEAVPEAYRSERFVGTRVLDLVLVAGAADERAPTSWADLADPSVAAGLVMPDPGFAGSGFAALAWLGTSDGYGMDYYQALKDGGAVLVGSPVDVVTGVAEGNYGVGITLDKLARDAIADGSPLQLIWPDPGAIALYSPAAVVDGSDHAGAAATFVDFLVSTEGQQAIARTGWQPVRDDVAWPDAGPVVTVDWPAVSAHQSQLLDEFYAIFGP
jgi:iron(III) transport system substrate-binding protein